MFKKILVVEDFESASISVQKALKDLKISEEDADFVYYCDAAFELFKKSMAENDPYDLLITDLSFVPDYKIQNLKSGKQLISEIRSISPDLKILVFSGEKRAQKIRFLFDDLKINGFVSKGRMDVKDLKKAINTIYKDQKYLSQENLVHIRKNHAIELTTVQYNLLKLLSEGVFQKDVPQYLKQKNIKPNSLSSIEKIISQLKVTFQAKNNEQLIAICKDLGVL
ncbi:DNA-binding response regulator, NarL/FixJ family, contains REC and HTH domains [Halpernia humi]|uniref:DNA-binding response regulator, NarL/FixJ family, contains REC and HTH domains n=1 Tax=Halpernia humi TaxID=493375 RepID=A0A1H5SJ54_9FLAO|nr:response regulator [Halpernia humi]SEF49787.1 DNA-binding response regulator, NarL/FixJ family, contains REC and HTH domains [Halpernia humi]